MLVTLTSDRDILTLQGWQTDYGSEEGWWVEEGGLSGLWGGVGMRATETDNPSGNGQLWPGCVRAQARSLTVVLVHRADTSTLAELEARDRIADMVGRDLTVTVETDGTRRSIAGLIVAQPEFTHVDHQTCRAGFVIRCPDPLWRGLPVSVGGRWAETSGGGLQYPLYGDTGTLLYAIAAPLNRVTVPNVGRQDSWPVLHTDGASEWWRFTCAGRSVEMRHPTGACVVDCRAGTVTAGGVDQTSWLSRDDFFQIPPGGAEVEFWASGGVGFSVEVAPAWL